MDCCSQAGYTMLHRAAMEGHPKAVQVLLSAGADMEAQNKVGVYKLSVALVGYVSNLYHVLGIMRGRIMCKAAVFNAN